MDKIRRPRGKAKRINLTIVQDRAKVMWEKLPHGQRSRMVENFLLSLETKDGSVYFTNYFRIREIVREELRKSYVDLVILWAELTNAKTSSLASTLTKAGALQKSRKNSQLEDILRELPTSSDSSEK